MNQPEEFFSLEDREEQEFERALTAALRPIDPPPCFAAGVLDRTQAAERSSARPERSSRLLQMPERARLWTGAAIAATLLVAALAGEGVHLRHQRQQAELAQREFQAALRITDRTLEHTREQLRRDGIALNDPAE